MNIFLASRSNPGMPSLRKGVLITKLTTTTICLTGIYFYFYRLVKILPLADGNISYAKAISFPIVNP
jgi:hypothetical protein